MELSNLFGYGLAAVETVIFAYSPYGNSAKTEAPTPSEPKTSNIFILAFWYSLSSPNTRRWNRFLALTNETYKNTGKGLSRYDLQSQLPSLKKEYEWLADTYSQCLQVVCLNLSRAFINFFEKRAQFPRFKSKHGKQSLAYPQLKIAGASRSIFSKMSVIGMRQK